MFALESNPDLSFALRARSAEKRSGTGPTSRQLQEKVRRRSARLAFSRWAIAQLEVYRIPNIGTLRREVGQSLGILRNQSLLC